MGKNLDLIEPDRILTGRESLNAIGEVFFSYFIGEALEDWLFSSETQYIIIFIGESPMTNFSIGDVSDGQFAVGVLRRLSDASPTGALREGVKCVYMLKNCPEERNNVTLLMSSVLYTRR